MADLLTHSIPRSVWHGWGDRPRRTGCPITPGPISPSGWGQPARAPAPPGGDREGRAARGDARRVGTAALEGVVGADHVCDDRAARVEHAGGKPSPTSSGSGAVTARTPPTPSSTPARPPRSSKSSRSAPEHRVAVVPFGGGTSVVGESAPCGPFASVITLDLRRLAGMTALDPVSKVATFQAGMRGPEVEAALRPFGFTLGHYPQSHQEATIGGYVATRSAGQASTGYGRIDEIVLGAGSPRRRARWSSGAQPGQRRRTGPARPRRRQRGRARRHHRGHLQVAAFPAAKRHGTWAFPALTPPSTRCASWLRTSATGSSPTCRLSDPDETEVSVTMAGPAGKAWRHTQGSSGEHPGAGRLRLGGPTVVSCVGAPGAARRCCGDTARSSCRRRWLGPGSAAGSPGRTCAMSCSTTTCSPRPWRPRRPGPTCGPPMARFGRRCMAPSRRPGRRRWCSAMCRTCTRRGVALLHLYCSVCRGPGSAVVRGEVGRLRRDPCVAGDHHHHHAIGTDHALFLGEEVGTLGLRLLAAAKATLDPRGSSTRASSSPSTARARGHIARLSGVLPDCIGRRNTAFVGSGATTAGRSGEMHPPPGRLGTNAAELTRSLRPRGRISPVRIRGRELVGGVAAGAVLGLGLYDALRGPTRGRCGRRAVCRSGVSARRSAAERLLSRSTR